MTSPRNTILAALLAATSGLTGSALAADPPKGGAREAATLESLVPPEVYRAAGLEKLSGPERAALLDWLAGRGAPTAPERAATAAAPAAAAPVATAPVAAAAPVAATAPVVTPAPYPPLSEPREIATRIVSPFTGWEGRTLFTMENGQVWQQRMDGRYSFRGTDTRVIIRKGAFGLDRMEVVATGRWIGVKRVR